MITKDAITEREAWRLFQIAAISEALSWILLLVGILIKYVIHPGDNTWVAIGGSIHGTIFLAYAVAVLGLFRVLELTFWQVILAAIASVVPFGTLAYELWLGAKRTKEGQGSFRQVVVRGVVREGKDLLAIQQSDVSFWCLPGGVVGSGETPEQALVRTISGQTGIVPVIGSVEYVQQYSHRGVTRLELFYSVPNNHDFSVEFTVGRQQERPGLDAVSFISLKKDQDFRPKYFY